MSHHFSRRDFIKTSALAMPFILAGKAGGKLQTKRWLKFQGQPHNNLLVSILNLFGIEQSTFGNASYCTGSLSGLV